MDIIITNKFKTKSGGFNSRWKFIYENLNQSEKDYIDDSFPLYSDIENKLKSFVFGGYKYCESCNKMLLWTSKKSCSKECSIFLRKKTNMEKYGVESPLQNKEILEKMKETNIERYGVKIPLQNKDIQDKIKKTNIERYGVENPIKLKEFKNKVKQTNIERYGVTAPLQNKEILEKMKDTNIERYGVENPSQNKDIQDKIKKTNIERYGYDTPLQNKDIQDKIKKTNIERYGVENPSEIKSVIEKRQNTQIDKKINYVFEKTGILVDGDYAKIMPLNINDIHDNEYIEHFAKYYIDKNSVRYDFLRDSLSTSAFNKMAKLYGWETKYYSKSSYEITICEWLTENNIEYETSNKSILSPYELDIYIPEHKIAIEFNGTYWHSDKFKDKHYHQMKTKMCNDLGITLIHVYEYLYKDRLEAYKNIISAKLQLNERVYARKCILKEVSKQEEKEFLNKYHLQGFVGSNKCYGLYFKNELMTLCSFGKSRFNKKYEYELLRNCSKPNITVVGGLSKIIKHYKKEIDNKLIICYSDASISYNKSELTTPNYVWVKNEQVLKRYQTMKHKLPKLLNEKFNSKLSETENMKLNGFNRIYDSGNYITIY